MENAPTTVEKSQLGNARRKKGPSNQHRMEVMKSRKEGQRKQNELQSKLNLYDATNIQIEILDQYFK